MKTVTLEFSATITRVGGMFAILIPSSLSKDVIPIKNFKKHNIKIAITPME